MFDKKQCKKCGKKFYSKRGNFYCDSCRKNVVVPCAECGKNFILSRKQLYAWQRDIDDTHLYFCSLKCRKSNADVVKKIKDTYKKRTGYDNPSQNPEIKKKKEDTCMKNHGVKYYSQSKEFWDKIKQQNLEVYGVEYSVQRPEIINKIMTTKEKNGWRSQEEKLFEERLGSVGLRKDEHFYTEYWDANYPYSCDFYIPSRKLYIELNCFPTHGISWYDKNDKNDVQRLNNLNKLKDKKWIAKTTIKVWGINDVKKRNIARQNKLNYVVLWNAKDIEEWFSLGMPDGQDWKYEYSWKEKHNQNHKTLEIIKKYRRRDIIYQYNTNGNILNAFWGINEAAKQTGINKTVIKNNLNKNHGICNKQFYFGIEKLSQKRAYSYFVANKIEHTIYQYDSNGLLMAKFNNTKEAALKTGLSANTISMACIQQPKVYKGFVFSRVKLTKKEVFKRYKRKNPKEYKVYQYNLEGKLLNVFDNANKAAEVTKINKGTIQTSGIAKKYICDKKYIFSKTKLTKGEIKKRVMRSNLKY